MASNTMVVILAAGKGTRMGRNDMAKVCFEIDGIPAINRTIATFQKLGFENFMLTIGDKAEQVLETVNAINPSCLYVYQQPQLGTGHAAKLAAEALEKMNFQGNVIVTLGDKFIESAAVEMLAEGFIKQQADLSLLTIPKGKKDESAGRVFADKTGQIIDIIEKVDIARQSIADELSEKIKKHQHISPELLVQIINKFMPSTKKQAVAVPQLLALAKTPNKIESSALQKVLSLGQYNIEIAGEKFTAEEIETCCKGVNPSLYMFRHKAFYHGTSLIDNNNAQKEYYLTDIVRQLSSVKIENTQKYKVRAVHIANTNYIQGFNSPDELLGIQDYVRRQKLKADKTSNASTQPVLKSSQYCTVRQWLDKLDSRKSSLTQWLNHIYGKNEQLHKEKLSSLKKVLTCYGKNFGFDHKVCIVRAPGRINLMGRHVDHRGGYNNFLALDRETIVVAGLRDDNNVTAVNVMPQKFKSVRFNISELIGRFAWGDWLNFVNSDWVRTMLHSAAGNWGNYIKAAILRLQHRFTDIKVGGMNLAFCGDVPIAAGLSSSSTIVVATLQAAIALNNFDLTSQQFIDLCGEGEWFVGSRGGAGDHAAIYLGQRGKIAQVRNLPFKVEKIIDAPKDYQVIIANSHIKAAKSEAAKHTFNAKIASYNLGLALLKLRCPQIAEMVEYLRDINPENLACTTSDIYRLMLKVPQFLTRAELSSLLGAKHRQLLETNFASHKDPGKYNIRGILLFGICEIARSKRCLEYIETGRIDEFGNLMKISHNGDRVSCCLADGKYHRLKPACDDDYINRLISDLSSEDPQRVLNAQLYYQPGEYGCSTEEIDKMVDIAVAVDGVAGAQIAGAGLGGCIMILAEKRSVDKVRNALIKHYYRPAGLKPAVLPCITTEGAGLADF